MRDFQCDMWGVSIGLQISRGFSMYTRVLACSGWLFFTILLCFEKLNTVFHSLNDRVGRKAGILWFHLARMFGALLSLYAPGYITFVTGRFFMAFGETGSSVCSFVISKYIK